MPPRSKVEQLPKEAKEWLDAALVEGNFAGYELLASELKARGFDISKTAVHRYGQEFAERLKILRVATEQARAVIEAAPDDDDSVNQALLRITQEKLFTFMLDYQIDPEKVDMAKITRSIADLAKASTGAKDFAIKVRAKAKEAAAEVADTVKKAGLTDEAAEQIRRRILGIAE
jgi:hypothetical protein